MNFSKILLVPGYFGLLVAFALILTQGIYSYVSVWGVNFHAWTLLVLCLCYVVGMIRASSISVVWRLPVVVMLIVFGVHFYDFAWGLVSMMFRDSPPPLGSVLGMGIAGLILWRLNRMLKFLEPRISTALLSATLGGVLYILGIQDYYQAMTLYDAGLGPDPNVNALWMISKFLGIYASVNMLRWSHD